jgi:hypothetical protein
MIQLKTFPVLQILAISIDFAGGAGAEKAGGSTAGKTINEPAPG